MSEPQSLVRITRTRLADGRALTYYDDREPYASGTADRDPGRRLPMAGAQAALGYGHLWGKSSVGRWRGIRALSPRETRWHESTCVLRS
ncbi:MAG: hypothetical protein ACRDRX_10220 [Pseudonocardiaceae bacterium]